MTADGLKQCLGVSDDYNPNTKTETQKKLAKEISESIGQLDWGDQMWVLLLIMLFCGFKKPDAESSKGETTMTKDELLKQIGAENKDRMSVNEIQVKMNEDWLKERLNDPKLTDEDKEALDEAQRIIDNKAYPRLMTMILNSNRSCKRQYGKSLD